jgi:acylphosphatase
MAVERSARLTITGRVQGVGYRAFVEREAARRGLSGWVRNRRDGSVEALISGPSDVVEAMIAACKIGPRSAIVLQVAVDAALVPPAPGFRVLATE